LITNQDGTDSINNLINISNYFVHHLIANFGRGEHRQVLRVFCLVGELVEQGVQQDVHVVQVEELDRVYQEIAHDLVQLDEDLHVIFVIILQFVHFDCFQQLLGVVRVLVLQHHDDFVLLEQQHLLIG
jgi:hypothetical protein